MSAAVGTYKPQVKAESAAGAAPAVAKTAETSHLEAECGKYLPTAVIKELLPLLGPHFHSSHILHGEVANHQPTGVYISKTHHVVQKGPPVVKETTCTVFLRTSIPGAMHKLFRKNVTYASFTTSPPYSFKKPTDDSKAFFEALPKYIAFLAAYKQVEPILLKAQAVNKKAQEDAQPKVMGQKAPPAKEYELSVLESMTYGPLYEKLRDSLI